MRSALGLVRNNPLRITAWVSANTAALAIGGSLWCQRQDLPALVILGLLIGVAQSLVAAQTIWQMAAWVVLTTFALPLAVLSATVLVLVVGFVAASIASLGGAQREFFGLGIVGAILVAVPAVVAAGAIVGVLQAPVFVVQAGHEPRPWIIANIFGGFLIGPLLLAGCVSVEVAALLGLGLGLVTAIPLTVMRRSDLGRSP